MKILYHGTSSAYVEDISRDGLRRPHLTTDRSLAVAFAEEQVHQAVNEGWPEGRPVVIEIDMASLDRDLLRNDEDSMDPDQAEWESYGYSVEDVRTAAREKNPDWVDEGGGLRLPPTAWELSLRFTRTMLYSGVVPWMHLIVTEV